jgi:protein O-GlcNAc transferase
MDAASNDLINRHLQAALAAEHARRNDEALAHYQSVLSIDPAHPGALLRVAQSLRAAQRSDEAIAMLQTAIRSARERGLASQSLPIHTELLIWLRDGAPQERLIAARDAQRDCGEVPGLLWEECECLRALNESYARALRLNRLAALQPRDAVILAELGLALVHIAPLTFQAIKPLRDAIALGESGRDVRMALAAVEIPRGELESAETRLRELVGQDPTDVGALGKLWNIERLQCRWKDADAHEKELVRLVESGAYSEWLTPFALLDAKISPHALRGYAVRFQRKIAPAKPRIHRVRDKKSRLRIGYLSGDFHTHAVACHLVGLIEAHDSERVETFAYSCGARVDNDPYRERLKLAFEHWRDLNEVNDSAAAHMIASDEIDVLFDMSGPTHGNRSGILSYRPASRVIHYLGYPGTIASSDVDYLLADETVVPTAHEPYYCERVLRMPRTYQVNDPKRERPASPKRRDVGLPENAIVLCNFNRPAKWTESFMRIWLRALGSHENAVLWLHETDAQKGRGEILAIANEYGVANRIVWAPVVSMSAHLARHGCADLALDQLPYSSHATGANALWMGAPLLTCLGATFQGRVGASLARACELDDFVTRDLEDYEHTLNRLLSNPARLVEAKQHLLERGASLPLFDGVAFTRELDRLLFDLCDAA